MALLDVSKMITERQDLCEYVDWFMRVHREPLASALTKTFQPGLEEGQPAPDVLGVINALIVHLRGSLESLIETEMDLLDETSETSASRQVRNELIERLRTAFVGARGLLRYAYGPEKAQAAGFPSRIAIRPLALLRQILRVSRKLRSAAFELGEPLFEAAKDVTREMILAAFEPVADELRQALDSVTENRSKTHGAQVAKDKAQDEFDDRYVTFVRLLEAAFRLGGQPELAKRFRPTVPQRSAASEPLPDPSSEDDDSPGDDALGDPQPPAPPSDDEPAGRPDGDGNGDDDDDGIGDGDDSTDDGIDDGGLTA